MSHFKKMKWHYFTIGIGFFVGLGIWYLFLSGNASLGISKGPSGKQTLDWNNLAQMDYITGSIPKSLQGYDGKKIRVPGFIVPLEDDRGETGEFLLVPDGMSCIHAPPPPPNQVVYVKMINGRKIFNQWMPVWIEGVFHISAKEQRFGTSSFTLDGESSELWKPSE